MSELKNIQIMNVNFVGSNIVKYACLSNIRCIPFVELKYAKWSLLINNLTIPLPDKFMIWQYYSSRFRSIIKNKFNSEIILMLDNQILGIYGSQELKMQRPPFATFGKSLLKDGTIL